MARRYVITLSVLAGLLSSAGACTPFETPRPPPDAASDASGGGTGGGTGGTGGASGSAGSSLARPGWETLAPAPTTGGAVQLIRQRLSDGSSVTCKAGICFSGGIEP